MQKTITYFLLLLSMILLIAPVFRHIRASLLQSVPSLDMPVKKMSVKTTSATLSALTASLPAAETPDGLYAAAYCLMDGSNGRVLLEKESQKQLPMASTTKIMTCLIALEYGNLTDTVTVSAYAASMPDVQLNMCEGDTFILKDLLYSLMLESHNDTAVAIAEHIGGTVEGFAKLMNEKAADLGLTNTHFVTPNGLDDDEHYTTAEELALLASYAITNDDFIAITNTPSYTISEQKTGKSYSLHNHNAFLTMYEGAVGVKTGFTNNAGYCFVGAVKSGKNTFVASVLACGWPPHKTYKWSDTTRLMNYAVHGFEKKKIKPSEITLPKLTVSDGTSRELSLMLADDSPFRLLLTATDTVTCDLSLPEGLTAPVREGDIIGELSYYVNHELYTSIPVTASASVPAADYTYFFKKLLAAVCI